MKWIQLVGIVACSVVAGCRTAEKSAWDIHRPTQPAIARAEQNGGHASHVSFAAAAGPAEAASPAEAETASQSATDGRQQLQPTVSPGADSARVVPVAWDAPPQAPVLAIAAHVEETDDSLLTLNELLDIAAARNPTLRQAEGLLRQAEGNWLQAGLYPNPVMGYNGGGNNGPFDQQGAFVSQNVVTARKLRLNRAIASHDVERAQWEAATQSLRVVNEVRIRYVAALGAQRQVAVAKELVDVAEKGVKTSEQLLEGEQVSRADVLQARIQLNQTQILLRNAQFHAAATWRQLGNVIGWPDLPVRALEGRLEEDALETSWEAAWQRLLDENPLLLAARARAAASAIQVRREEVQAIPDLQVTGNLWNDTIHPPSMMYGLNVGVALPFYDRNQGNVSAAVGEFIAAQAEVTRLELALRDNLAEAFQHYEAARNQVHSYREIILPMAQENLSLTLKAYEEGEFDFLRVLTARRDLFQTNIEYVRALTDLRIATIEIEGMQLTGGLEPVQSNPTPSNQAGQTTGPGN